MNTPVASPSPTPFVYWPDPSPTSKYRINVRFYRVNAEEGGSVADWDIGPQYEALFETMYEAMLGEGKASTPREFETFIRHLVENRLGFMTGIAVYPAALSLLLGDGNLIFDDMVRQTDMMVKLYNKLAKMANLPPRTNPFKPDPFWKKLFS